MDNRIPTARQAWGWVAITVLVYVLSLVALAPALWTWAFTGAADDAARESSYLLKEPGTWAVIAGLTLVQFVVLVLVPMPIVRQRPVSRGRWIVLAAVSALLLGLLGTSFLYVLIETLKLDRPAGEAEAWLPAVFGSGIWVVWTVIFSLYHAQVGERIGLRRIVDRWLAGSVAELAIAVPCHLYVRRRDECCAGFSTFFGLSTGLAVLSFALGPAIFLLFATRLERLRRAQDAGHGQARDAIVYFFGSQLFLLAGLAWSWLLPAAGSLLVLSANFGAAVFLATGLIHAVRALRALGLTSTALLVAAALAVEILAVGLWIWEH